MPRLILLVAMLIPVLAGAESLRVFVSVLPQKTFVEKVGADHVEVRIMVRPGHNPHTYEPTPQQISALATAALYVRTGVPFEETWMGRILSANPAMQVLDARSGIDLRAIDHHHVGDDGAPRDRHHDEGQRDGPHRGAMEPDPHVWTDPLLVKLTAATIRDALVELDPARARDYARNYEAFAAELDDLDRAIRATLKDLVGSKIMVFHPAWGYFAASYGLVQVPIQEAGKEPGARALATLIEQAREENVRAIFVQPHFDARSAAQVARAIGGRVVPLDPLAADYVSNMRAVAERIAEALRP